MCCRCVRVGAVVRLITKGLALTLKIWRILYNIELRLFRYELFEVADGKFGVTNETGHWNGMVGVLARKVR